MLQADLDSHGRTGRMENNQPPPLMITHSLPGMDASGFEVSLTRSNENLSGLIIAQGVFGLSSLSAVWLAALCQTGNSNTEIL